MLAYLWELALLIDQSKDTHRPHSNHIQCLLVVHELYVCPVNGLVVVFLLLQLENVPHKELLKVLIGVVDAQLFKTGTKVDKVKKITIEL